MQRVIPGVPRNPSIPSSPRTELPLLSLGTYGGACVGPQRHPAAMPGNCAEKRRGPLSLHHPPTLSSSQENPDPGPVILQSPVKALRLDRHCFDHGYFDFDILRSCFPRHRRRGHCENPKDMREMRGQRQGVGTHRQTACWVRTLTDVGLIPVSCVTLAVPSPY